MPGRWAQTGTLLVVGLIVGAISACRPGAPRSDAAPATSVPTPFSTPAATSSGTSASPRPVPASSFPSIAIRPGDRALIRPMSGTRNRRTPTFKVTGNRFTVEAICVGKGTVTIVPRTTGVSIPCDGSPRHIQVISDQHEAAVKIVTAGSVRWTVAVLLTEDSATSGPATAPTEVPG